MILCVIKCLRRKALMHTPPLISYNRLCRWEGEEGRSCDCSAARRTIFCFRCFLLKKCHPQLQKNKYVLFCFCSRGKHKCSHLSRAYLELSKNPHVSLGDLSGDKLVRSSSPPVSKLDCVSYSTQRGSWLVSECSKMGDKIIFASIGTHTVSLI